MYFPQDFDTKRAIELCKLVNQAYQQFQNFKQMTPWKLQGDYNLVTEISYHTILSFEVGEEGADTTVIDQELQNALPPDNGQVSFGFSLDSLVGKDIPMGFLATQGKTAYLVFRGTVTPREWLFDISTGIAPYRFGLGGMVAQGFSKIYERCRDSFIKKAAALSPSCERLFIAGHSLGGALSVLSLPDVVKSTPFQDAQVYNYGCPRVGDNDFASAYNNLPKTATYRVVNTSDLVTSVPLPISVPFFPSGNFTHVGIPVDFTIQGNDLGFNHSTDTYIKALGG